MIACWQSLSVEDIATLKMAAGALAVALLVWEWWARRRRHESRLWGGVRAAAFAAVGITAAALWWNLGHFHYGAFHHHREMYHYYLGAKYPELGYERIYECTATAEFEEGRGSAVRMRKIRDLATNRIESTQGIEAASDRCKSHFTPERWQSFKRDAAWFWSNTSFDGWRAIQIDHGYNGSPAWAIMGSVLADLGPASGQLMNRLACADPLLLFAMWALIVWAFGWQTLWVALLWWGANALSHFDWTGGAFLRQDWLFCTVAGICLLKRRRYALAGAALGCASLLRVFPAFLLAGLFAKVVAESLAARRLAIPRAYWRFAAGFGLAVAILVPASMVVARDAGVWVRFWNNSAKHLDTYATNHLGLRTVLAYAHESRGEVVRDPALLDSWSVWKATQAETFQRRKPLFFLAVLAYFGLLVFASRGEPDWVVLTLGAGLIPVGAYLACYYYSLLLVYALLWERLRERIGLALALLAIGTQVASEKWDWYDQRYWVCSIEALALVVVVTAGWRWLRIEPCRVAAGGPEVNPVSR